MIIFKYKCIEDPYEYNNLARENPTIVKEMMNRLQEYRLTMIPPDVGDDSEKGNPQHFNGTFSPGWCQSEPITIDSSNGVAIEIIP